VTNYGNVSIALNTRSHLPLTGAGRGTYADRSSDRHIHPHRRADGDGGSRGAEPLSGTDRGERYMGLATTRGSEKLEDFEPLARRGPARRRRGSLTTDAPPSAINYYGRCQLINTNGYVSETIASNNGIYHDIFQCYTQTPPDTWTRLPPRRPRPVPGSSSFHRRWLIESNPVVNGITLNGSRRVTVW